MRLATRRACPRIFPLRVTHWVAHRPVRNYTQKSMPEAEKAYADLKTAKNHYDKDQGTWQPLVQALLRFGVHLESGQLTTEAETCFKEAHRIANTHNPADIATALLVGNALRKQGRFADAFIYYDETIGKLEKKKPTNPSEWSVLGHALEGKAKCVVLQDDVPSAVFLIKESLDALKLGLPMTFAESAQEWVKFLMGVYEKPHLQTKSLIGDLSFAEHICSAAITELQGAVTQSVAPNAPQLLLDSLVDMSSIKTNQLDFPSAEVEIDKAYDVWRQHVKPIVADDERDLMEMQMRLLAARRSHANAANVRNQYRKTVADYTAAIRLGESTDNPLKKPAFDLLATAYSGLGHLRLELGGGKESASTAEADKCFETLRALQRDMLTLPDPLSISASFITKRAELSLDSGRYLLRLNMVNRRPESVWAQVSVRGSISATAEIVDAGKELRLELPNIDLGQRSLNYFQEVVVQVFDESKKKPLDVHREFIMTT